MGVGDFFGTKQSGLPAFRIADILQDQSILESAREAAFKLMARDPGLTAAENRVMRDWFETFVLSEGLRLSRIG